MYYGDRHRKILRSANVCEDAGIDDLSGRFLKNGSRVLSKPISELCNLSIKPLDRLMPHVFA